MAFEPAISSKLDVSMNVNALRLADPSLNQLLDHATHAVVYSFDHVTDEWDKMNIEGALFIYSRKTAPRYNMTILNRLNTNNFVEPVNGGIVLQVHEPFLLYRNGEGKIYGIWFYLLKECCQISKTLSKLQKEFTQNSKKNGNVDNMMSLLSVSEGSKRKLINSNKVKVPDGTSKRVLDFFAMAKNTTPCQPPGGNQRPPGGQQRAKHEETQDDVKPLLQRLLSNPNQPVKTVEQIEKQHMSTTPRRESAPIDIVEKSLYNNSNQAVRPRSLISTNSVGSSDEKKLENGFGFVRISESSPHSDSPLGCEPLDEPGSSVSETPGKVPLFTPNMFMANVPESVAEKITVETTTPNPEVDLDIRPEPLTKAQLLQAITYLLKNDPDFVYKLHDAYVKSFMDRVS